MTDHLTLIHAEATDLQAAVKTAIIQAARDRGQYESTGHGALAAEASARVGRLLALQHKLDAVWRDRAPDAEFGLWRAVADDAAWRVHDGLTEAGE